MSLLIRRAANGGIEPDAEEHARILIAYFTWSENTYVENMEEYDFSGKTIVPFCSHGGGRFGQSLTAIAKLAPDSTIGEGLAISYSGGSGMPSDVSAWLEKNDVSVQ